MHAAENRKMLNKKHQTSHDQGLTHPAHSQNQHQSHQQYPRHTAPNSTRSAWYPFLDLPRQHGSPQYSSPQQVSPHPQVPNQYLLPQPEYRTPQYPQVIQPGHFQPYHVQQGIPQSSRPTAITWPHPPTNMYPAYPAGVLQVVSGPQYPTAINHPLSQHPRLPPLGPSPSTNPFHTQHQEVISAYQAQAHPLTDPFHVQHQYGVPNCQPQALTAKPTLPSVGHQMPLHIQQEPFGDPGWNVQANTLKPPIITPESSKELARQKQTIPNFRPILPKLATQDPQPAKPTLPPDDHILMPKPKSAILPGVLRDLSLLTSPDLIQRTAPVSILPSQNIQVQETPTFQPPHAEPVSAPVILPSLRSPISQARDILGVTANDTPGR